VYTSSFFEIREVDTGKLLQVLPASNIKVLEFGQGLLECSLKNKNGFQKVVILKRILDTVDTEGDEATA
jgi:hypothetical protein